MKTIDDAHGRTLELIRQAILAPSSHNTQPWLFRVCDAVIELRADRRRALPVYDPDDRELTVSCGCALMNLRIAAAASGFSRTCTCCPMPRIRRCSLGSPSRPHAVRLSPKGIFWNSSRNAALNAKASCLERWVRQR